MKKLSFWVSVLLTCLVCVAHAQSRNERRIYLWDVTLSMSGYNGTPDIYGDVVDFLVRDISSLTDESTEIVVLPFQESILERWTVRADEAGKKEVIARIRHYRNNVATRTDIVGAVDQVRKEFVDSDCNNMLILLTDGRQSEDKHEPQTGRVIRYFGGQARLHAEVADRWQEYGVLNNVYLLYVMLTRDAVDPIIVERLDNKEFSSVLYPADSAEVLNVVEMVELRPVGRVKLNVKDGTRRVEIPLICKKNRVLPADVRIAVRTSEGPLEIDTEATIEHNRIVFDLGHDLEVLRSRLDEHTDIVLKLDLLNGQDIRKNTGKILIVNPVLVVFELINKQEKTLTIKLKK